MTEKLSQEEWIRRGHGR